MREATEIVAAVELSISGLTEEHETVTSLGEMEKLLSGTETVFIHKTTDGLAIDAMWHVITFAIEVGVLFTNTVVDARINFSAVETTFKAFTLPVYCTISYLNFALRFNITFERFSKTFLAE